MAPLRSADSASDSALGVGDRDATATVFEIKTRDVFAADATIPKKPQHQRHLPILPPDLPPPIDSIDVSQTTIDGTKLFFTLDDEEMVNDDSGLSLTLDSAIIDPIDMDPAYTYYAQATVIRRPVSCNNKEQESRMLPVLLHRIINSGTYRDSIVWLGHGRAFAIIDKKKFVREVISRFFSTYEYNAFLTWMCAYGFKEICGLEDESNGWCPNLLIFYHKKLLRDQPWLAATMEYTDIGGNAKELLPTTRTSIAEADDEYFASYSEGD